MIVFEFSKFEFAKCARILKNSMASKWSAGERTFLMKETAAVEEAPSNDSNG
jgi:hypothetical protein